MGFFGGGDSGASEAQQRSDELINQQFRQNQAEIEAKKKNLFQERLDIIKSQSGQSWHPTKK
ncbi:MAG TPA: hypothetical protein VNU45_18110 [Rummeliibacillus sp.]|nr:hypothetical protein [Rummeliibacillus sp.]